MSNVFGRARVKNAERRGRGTAMAVSLSAPRGGDGRGGGAGQGGGRPAGGRQHATTDVRVSVLELSCLPRLPALTLRAVKTHVLYRPDIFVSTCSANVAARVLPAVLYLIIL